jgi:hypothetical protein
LRALVALGAAALVAGCGGGQAEPGSAAGESPTAEGTATAPGPTPLALVAGASAPGLPDAATSPETDAAAGAARTDQDGLVYVVTFGSSTCPDVPDPEAEAGDDGSVRVTFPEPGDGVCTQDYVPTTSVVGLPADVDPTADLRVDLGSRGEVTLPAGSQDVVWSGATG